MTQWAANGFHVDHGLHHPLREGGLIVGHRALIARERPDGTHDVHYSQWGGADLSLANELSSGTWPARGVATEPLATGVAWTDLVETHLDPLLHEALYVVEASGDVRAYRSRWLGVDGEGPDGLLVGVRWTDSCDDVRVRAWLQGARAVAGRAIGGSDVADPASAATLVERCLREWAADREVIRVP